MTTPAAGLNCHGATIGDGGHFDLVLLHGYAMKGGDFAPFAQSLGIPGRYFFPDAPISVPGGGNSWWPVDQERRMMSVALGARDFADQDPPGRSAARETLRQFLAGISADDPSRPLILGGFSQGGMLAVDYTVHGDAAMAGLVLLSSSRIALHDWQPRSQRLRALPVFVSHGRQDHDLAFSAGEALHEFIREAGARTVWCPFDGGHETPLSVWRELRRFLKTLDTVLGRQS